VPPFAGLRGSRSYSPDATPKNWREGILRLYPNGGAVLTALSALLEAEQTSDPEFNWWEKPLSTREVFTTGGAAGVTTLTISAAAAGAGDPGKLLRKNYILMSTGTGGTGEKMLVTADQTVGTSVVVQRGFGETVAGTIPADSTLRVIGNANEEGAPLPTPISVDPTKQFNYTQIFRTPLAITRTALKTRLRTEDAITQAQIEALENQAMDMEYSFLFGERLETTGSLGQPLRTTRGLVKWIEALAPANAITVTGVGELSEEEFLLALEPMYRYGSTEKLWLAGSTALMALNSIARQGSTLNIEAGDDVYGMRLRHFVTTLGDGYLRMHPLFNLYPDWRKMLLVIDLPHVRYRYIDDLMYLEHRQNPGEDAKKNEWLAECGFELHHAQTHGVIRNLAKAKPQVALSAQVDGPKYEPAKFQYGVVGPETPALPAGQPPQYGQLIPGQTSQPYTAPGPTRKE
jgi:Family of unknown function (DUF5309)